MTSNDDRAILLVREAVEHFAIRSGVAADLNSEPSQFADRGRWQKTVSSRSLDAYRQRGLTLLNEYTRVLDATAAIGSGQWPVWLPSPLSWAQWLVGVKAPAVSRATWRLYRRSAMETLSEWPCESIYLEDALALLAESAFAGGPTAQEHAPYKTGRPNNPIAKTSAKRLRFISPADVAIILSACLDTKKWSHNYGSSYLDGDSRSLGLMDWMVAGLATAFRPCEWRQSGLVYFPADGTSVGTPKKTDDFWVRVTATFEQGSAALEDVWKETFNEARSNLEDRAAGRLFIVAYNAKHSNNRGNLATRAIDLSSVPIPIRLSIVRMVIRGRTYCEDGVWKQFQDACRTALNRINKKYFPERNAKINLYTCRHQALANFNAELGSFGTSVLAGHGDADSSEEFYSTGKKSWNRLWADSIQLLLSGDINGFYDSFRNGDYELEKDGRMRRKSRKGKGTFRVLPLENLRTVGELMTSLAQLSVPRPNAMEFRTLEERMAQVKVAAKRVDFAKLQTIRPKYGILPARNSGIEMQ